MLCACKYKSFPTRQAPCTLHNSSPAQWPLTFSKAFARNKPQQEHKPAEACNPHEWGRELAINPTTDSPHHNRTPSGNLHTELKTPASKGRESLSQNKNKTEKRQRTETHPDSTSTKPLKKGASSKSVGLSFVHHRSGQLTRKSLQISNNHFHRNESCSPADTATRRYFPYSNKFRLTMRLSYKRQWSIDHLQRRQITPNSAEMIRECAYWTSKAQRAFARSLYRKLDKRPRLSSAILKNQVRSNYVKHKRTKSNIIPRQVSCNTQTSKITILYEHIKRQFSRILQNPTSKEKSQKTQDPESVPSVPRFITPTSSPNNKCKSPFLPAARSGGPPASSPV